MLNYEASILLTSICYCLLEAVYHEQKETTPPVISKIKEYLTENYADDLTLERLSQSFFLSKSYLQKQFKKYIGISPWDYLLQLRMTEGKRLLRTSDFSVHEIAWRVGFNDVSYFVQVFRNLEKITPLQYRILWTSNQLPFSNWTSKESYGNSAERMRYQQGIDNTGFHVSVLQVRGRCCQCVCNWMIREPNTIRHDFSPEVQAIKDKRVFAPI